MKSICLILGSWMVMPSFAPLARGELVTFSFTGTVTSVFVDHDYQSFEFPQVGDPFIGFYTFDPSSSLTVLPYPALGVKIGDLEFEGRAINIGTLQNLYQVTDYIPSIELISGGPFAADLVHNNFSLLIRKENLFPAPLDIPPPLAGADEASLLMWLDDMDDLRPFPEVAIAARLESLTRVPEPSSLFFALIVSSLFLSRQARGNQRGPRSFQRS